MFSHREGEIDVSKLTKLLVAMCMILGGATVYAGSVPAGKEKLSIDAIKGKKGAVELAHADHTTKFKKKDGSAIECKDCHHTYSGSGDVKACTSCHAAPGEAQKEHGGKKAANLATMKGDKADTKSVLYHNTCKDSCHKAVGKSAGGKKLTSCKTCHK